MQIDVSILSTNEYLPGEITREEIPEKYLYDEEGEFLFTSTIFHSTETVTQLIHFLFRGTQSITEVYRDNKSYILDLTSYRNHLIEFEYLEHHYQNWIEVSGRDNTMDEYGMLVDFIGHIQKGIERKHLFIIVSKRWLSN